MYAKIENEITKECTVGIGTAVNFYKSIGMTEMDVEKAYNGRWYLKGYAPEKPQELINQERIEELKANIAASDAIIIELIEKSLLNSGNLVMPTNTDIDYSSILANRVAWRSEIKQLQQNISEHRY